jgi:hypothetical protein
MGLQNGDMRWKGWEDDDDKSAFQTRADTHTPVRRKRLMTG